MNTGLPIFWRPLVVTTLSMSLSCDLVLGNLAMPRMTITWLATFALGVAAAKLMVTWRNGRLR